MVASIYSQQPAFRGGGGPTYDTDAAALFSRMSVQPDNSRKSLINNAIVSMKSAGIWSKLYAVYFLAAHDAQAGILNWKSTDYTLVGVNSPSFTTDRGYGFDGSSSYMSTQYTPLVADRDNFSLGCYLNGGTDTVSAVGAVIGSSSSAANQGTFIRPWFTGDFLRARVNTNGTIGIDNGPVTTRFGFSSVSRTANTTSSSFRNATKLGTYPLAASDAHVPTFPFIIGGAVTQSNTPANFTDNRHAFDFLAQGLSDSEMASFYTIVSTYLTAVGAN